MIYKSINIKANDIQRAFYKTIENVRIVEGS